jgi:hypothetical protein
VVLTRVGEHVAEGPASFPRCLECACVVAVGEHSAASSQATVHGLGYADGEALHAACKRAAIVGFRQQMQVIPLHGEVHETKAEPSASAREGSSHRPEHRRSPQGVDAPPYGERDVDRMVTGERGPGEVRDAGRRSFGRAAGAGSGAAPGTELEAELRWVRH